MRMIVKYIAGRQGMLCCDLVLIICSLVNEAFYYILSIESNKSQYCTQNGNNERRK